MAAEVGMHSRVGAAGLFMLSAVPPLQEDSMPNQVTPKQFINPPALGPTFGWTHVVTSTGGKTIYVSGQTSVNDRGEVVGKGDLRKQTHQAFENVQKALAAAGATFGDVVKTSLFVVGLKPEHVPVIREVRSRFVSAERPPA